MKKMRLGNMKTKNKLITAFGIIFIMMAFIMGIGIYMVNITNNEQNTRYTLYGAGETKLVRAYGKIQEVKVHVRNMIYIYADDEQKQKEEIETIKGLMEVADGYLAEYEALLPSFDESLNKTYSEFKKNLDAYGTSVRKMMTMTDEGSLDAAQKELMGNGITAANNAEEKIKDVALEMDNDSIVVQETLEEKIENLRTVIFAAFVVALVIAVLFGTMIIRAINGPLNKLVTAARKLAAGDINVDCEKTNDDDFGKLLDEFKMMAANIREQAQIAESLSKGDLTVQVNPRGEADVLGRALLKLVTDNNATLGNIKESSMQVTVGAQQVAGASQSLAQGSTEQASAIEEVTASIDEIAERTRVNAEQANEANELVRSVKEDAVNGNDQMKDMIGAMREINESSERISKIIKVIDDIAFQTNILALNAAVEAARAGVHGKGFAVVAEEVRNLAAKSASAASETAEMIEDSIHKVEQGSALAEQTASALDGIVNAIERIVSLINNIAVASNDQATAVSQINLAINQVSQVVQTNSATSEECAAASEELSNQAAILRNLMSSYKLLSRNGSGSYMAKMPSTNNYMADNSNERIISLDDNYGKY